MNLHHKIQDLLEVHMRELRPRISNCTETIYLNHPFTDESNLIVETIMQHPDFYIFNDKLINDKSFVFMEGNNWFSKYEYIKKNSPSSRFIIILQDFSYNINSQNELKYQSFVDDIAKIVRTSTSYHDSEMFFVRYEDICKFPSQSLKRVTDFLESRPFDFSFNNIKTYSTKIFDSDFFRKNLWYHTIFYPDLLYQGYVVEKTQSNINKPTL